MDPRVNISVYFPPNLKHEARVHADFRARAWLKSVHRANLSYVVEHVIRMSGMCLVFGPSDWGVTTSVPIDAYVFTRPLRSAGLCSTIAMNGQPVDGMWMCKPNWIAELRQTGRTRMQPVAYTQPVKRKEPRITIYDESHRYRRPVGLETT